MRYYNIMNMHELSESKCFARVTCLALRKCVCCIAMASLLACSSENSTSDLNNSSDPDISNGMIVGKAWNLTTYTSLDGVVNEVPMETLYQFFLFEEDNLLSGFIGCVNTAGSYQLFDGSVTLILGSSNDESCITDEAEHGAQTRDIVLLFFSSQDVPLTYFVEDDELRLETPSGRFMEFEQISLLSQAQ